MTSSTPWYLVWEKQSNLNTYLNTSLWEEFWFAHSGHLPFIHPTSKDIPRAEKGETTFLTPRSIAERIRALAHGQTTWFESGSTVFYCVNWVNLISFCLSFLICLKMGIILHIYRIFYENCIEQLFSCCIEHRISAQEMVFFINT